MRLVQPVASRGVAALASRGVEPLVVVLAHGAVGLAAAALLALRGPAPWLAAAVLLQVKTVLDNIDGGLARATGRVTEAGRYLDTTADLIVNVALFGALARHGPALPAWLALVALTLILSLDFNLEARYRELRGHASPGARPLPEGWPRWVLGAPRALYRAVLAPQDRALRALDRRLFERVAGVPESQAPLELRLAWSDLFSTASIVNFGLSSQLALLGVLCALQRPYLYVGAVLLQLAFVLGLQGVRIVRLRRALRRRGKSAA